MEGEEGDQEREEGEEGMEGVDCGGGGGGIEFTVILRLFLFSLQPSRLNMVIFSTCYPSQDILTDYNVVR